MLWDSDPGLLQTYSLQHCGDREAVPESIERILNVKVTEEDILHCVNTSPTQHNEDRCGYLLSLPINMAVKSIGNTSYRGGG